MLRFLFRNGDLVAPKGIGYVFVPCSLHDKYNLRATGATTPEKSRETERSRGKHKPSHALYLQVCPPGLLTHLRIYTVTSRQ